MYQALYRTYRPEIFDEILGQEHIVRILKNQLSTDTVSHAYLFCGTRGTGKTTTARILAKGVNCLSDGDRPCGICANCLAIKEGSFMDVIEIDAASNNGVDNIRELRESVKYPPAVGRKKVYIIDEVHMLSTGAFNALLKTLEEPPENVMFILATTEPQKLPATILSRCMRLDFKRVPENVIKDGMARICMEMGVEATDGALKLVAANADGSVRDGLSILDQCLAAGDKKVTREDVLEFLGTSGEEVFIEMTDFVMMHKAEGAILLLDKILSEGKDVRQFMKDWLAHYRSLLIVKFIKQPEDILNMSCENVERIRTQSDRLDLGEINQAILELSKTIADGKWSTQPRILLELCIVKLAAGGMQMARSVQSGNGSAMPTAQINRGNAVRTAGERSGLQDSRDNGVSAAKEESIQPRANDASDTAGKEDGDRKAADTARIADAEVQEKKTDAEDGFDLEQLWYDIFEDGEALQGSLNIIRTGTSLTAVGEHTFTITVSSPAAESFAERKRQILEDLMAKHTGKRRRMEFAAEDRPEIHSPENNAEQFAKELSGILGLDIEVEK